MKSPLLLVLSVVSLFSVLGSACSPRRELGATPAPTVASTPILNSAVSPVATDVEWQNVITAAKKEGTVTLYSFYFIGDLGNATKAAFKEKYGISLEFITGTGSQLLPRIQSEYRAGQYVADVLDGSGINAIFAKKQGLTQSYGDLPEMRSKDVWVVDPHYDKEGQIIASSFTPLPLWINTKLLSPADAPKSWKAILDPRWKGKIVVTDPDTMPIPGRLLVVLTHHLGFSEDYFKELGNLDLVIAPNQRENDAMVARGQYAMTFTSAGTSMGPMIADGAPVVPIDLAEGVPSIGTPTIALLAKSPHTNASRLFLNWIMGKEGQDILGKFLSAASIRKDVANYSPPALKVQYTKLIQLSQQDDENAAQVQQDKILSKMWRKK